MTFEEWFSKHTRFGSLPDDQLTPMEAIIKASSLMAWNAAKEDSEEVEQESVWIVEPYENQHVKFITWHVVKKDNGELLFEALSAGRCVEWAIENGYRINTDY